MSLLDYLLDILSAWKVSFSRQPSYQRAVLLATASLCVLGRACISRIISFLGFEQKDWSAHYKLFSRSCWQELDLFQPIIQKALPMYQKNDQPPRSLPITFTEVPAVKKPDKKATEEEKQQYEIKKKEVNLSRYFLRSVLEVRMSLDKAGVKNKTMIAVVDGSFCNRTCMGTSIEGVCLVARARKDAKLCFRAEVGSRKFYGEDKFTPEQVRQNDAISWQRTSIYHGWKWREVRFKEVKEVLWQGGTKQQFLRLIVIAPTPYRLIKTGKLYYRNPAYLLCQVTEIASETLIQKYFDRWQIEVNHREEKDTLGIGQAQVRSKKSVPRQPVFVVAAYSALLLAGIMCFADQRNDAFIPLPKWRKRAKRPSCLDLVQLLRKELCERRGNKGLFGLKIDLGQACVKSAA